MEMSIVNQTDIPKHGWTKAVRLKIKEIQDKKNGNTIKVVLNRNENPAGIESAWRKVVSKELKKSPHVKILKHQLGSTVWLWWS